MAKKEDSGVPLAESKHPCHTLLPDSVPSHAQGCDDLSQAAVRMGNSEKKAPSVGKHPHFLLTTQQETNHGKYSWEAASAPVSVAGASGALLEVRP